MRLKMRVFISVGARQAASPSLDSTLCRH